MNSANLKYINKGLLIILSVFVLATIASIIFLSHILLKLDSLLSQSGQGVKTAFAVQDLYIDLDDAESSARGYIITGDESFLTAVDKSLGEVPAGLKAIESNIGPAVSRQQYSTLKELTETKVGLLRQSIENRKNGGEFTRVVTPQGNGTELMNRIRKVVSDITSASLQGISARQAESQSSLRQALWVAVAVTLFVLTICLLLIWYFQRSILRERALESTKNEFLSLASHQLRTPATNVKQYVGLLLDGYLGDLTEKQQEALKIAYKNNESEIKIMNDLLDVAKLDLKRIQLHKQSVNIVAVVRQVVKGFEKQAEERGQVVIMKAPPELVAEVDRGYFKGVVEKLVDNALKYSRDNTRILVKIRSLPALEMFEVIVKDKGLGIKKREVPKLFMKFSRLTNEFSANSEGSGLGLYWVKQIMSLHGGSVEVVSQEGQGSKFIARSPLH